MNDRKYNVLFLCTGNSARSIIAESILRKDGAARFNAFSAGSHLKGAINAFALRALEAYGYPTDGFHPRGGASAAFDDRLWPLAGVPTEPCTQFTDSGKWSF